MYVVNSNPWSQNMKPTERMIDDAIDLYFDTKRITESDILRNGSARLTQSPVSMLESSVLNYRTSQNNTYLYSCPNQNVQQMEVEFTRLRMWVNELESVKCKQELSQLLFPIFSHLYLDTFSETNDEQTHDAVRFFRRNQSFFTSESLRDIKKDIGNIGNKEEIESRPLVKTFRSAKCELKLSPMSATLLKNFISKCDEPTILLNVLSSWFVMEDEDNNIREDDDPAVCPESEIIMGQRVDDNLLFSKMDGDNTGSNSSESDLDNYDGLDCAVKEWAANFKNLEKSAPSPSPLFLLQIRNSRDICCSSVCYRSKLIATGCLDSDLKVLSFSEDRPVHSALSSANADEGNTCSNTSNNVWSLRGHSGSVSAVKFIRNPDIILSSSHDTTLRAWSKVDFTCTAVYQGHNSPIWSFDVGSLNLYVATGSQDKTARLWTLDKTYPLRLFAGHLSSVTCVKFHPNCVYLATGSSDATIRFFSVIDGKHARLFIGHTGPVHSLCFSPDGKYLASGGDSKEVIIWDLALGEQYLSISTSSQFVSDLSWNLDSSVLAITFLTQTITLIHVKKTTKEGQPEIIAKYELPEHRFSSCQFYERNNLIAVGLL